MRTVPLTTEQAEETWTILADLAGASKSDDARRSFVIHASSEKNPCDEYRFMGALGFGGKFRNNGNRDTPYVDCYPEHESPKTVAIIEAVNEALKALFERTSTPQPG